MSVAESANTANFLNSLEMAFLAPHTITLGTRTPYIFVSQEHHANIRKREIDNYLQTGGKGNNELPRAFMSEWTTYACLSSPFTDTDYHVGLAPAAFEHGGEGYKGDDILMSVKNKNNTLDPFLGINVKLQKKKPTCRDERHSYNPLTRSPSIQLSLGDWEFTSRELMAKNTNDELEGEKMKIRDWLNDVVVPRIAEGDKIPFFHDLRRFMVQRVNSTLGSYLWKADRFVNGEYTPSIQEETIFPKEGGDFTIFYEKLNLAKQLFDEVEEGMS